MPAGKKTGFGCCALVVNFILVVVIVFGGIAIYLHQVKYKGGNHWYHPTDMISINSITTDLSTVWCNGYKVEADQDSSLNVYLLPDSSARIDPYNRTYKDVNINDIEAGAKDKSSSFFLLEESIISVKACRKHIDRLDNVSSEILLFKGDAFTTWKSNMDCSDCILKQVHITEWCNTNKTNVLSYTVDMKDDYSIVLARRNSSRIGKKVYVKARLSLNKTRYYVDNAINKCMSLEECVLPLDYNTDRDVVVEFNDNLMVKDVFFSSDCQDRVILWVGVFLFAPGFLIFGLLGVLTCCELRMRRKQNQSLFESQQTPSQGYDKMNDADELVTN